MMFIDHATCKNFWYKHANLFMRMTNSCLRWRLESLQRLEYGCPFPLQVGGKVYILMLQKPKDDNAHRQVRNH